MIAMVMSPAAATTVAKIHSARARTLIAPRARSGGRSGIASVECRMQLIGGQRGSFEHVARREVEPSRESLAVRYFVRVIRILTTTRDESRTVHDTAEVAVDRRHDREARLRGHKERIRLPRANRGNAGRAREGLELRGARRSHGQLHIGGTAVRVETPQRGLTTARAGCSC